jgi:hypothetical protein
LGGELEDLGDNCEIDPEILDGKRTLKASKDDDAKVPVELWNDFTRRGLPPEVAGLPEAILIEAGDRIRVGLLMMWRRSVTRSFFRWVKERRAAGMCPSVEAMEAGRDAIGRAGDSSKWGWPAGSRPFFWRWPEEYQETIISGLKLWMMDKLEP